MKLLYLYSSIVISWALQQSAIDKGQYFFFLVFSITFIAAATVLTKEKHNKMKFVTCFLAFLYSFAVFFSNGLGFIEESKLVKLMFNFLGLLIVCLPMHYKSTKSNTL